MSRFRTDPHIAHRYAQLQREGRYVGGNNAAFWDGLARKIPCPDCGADADAPCVSKSKKEPGRVLAGVHHQRITAAREKHGRKE